MNRTAVAVLVAAGLLGATGGAALGLTRQPAHSSPQSSGARSATPSASPSASQSGTPRPRASETATPTASPSPTPSSTPDPTETNEPLLYAAGGVIHDGGTTATFRPKHPVVRLVRVQDGWLAATRASVRSEELQLWHVRRSGKPTLLAGVSSWDVNADGTQVVAFDFEAVELQVWDLAHSDRVLGRFAPRDGQSMTGVFVGGDVYLSEDQEPTKLLVWNVQTGETASAGAGFTIYGASPGGSYLLGSAGDRGCLQLRSTALKKYPVAWRSCRWRPWQTSDVPDQFSPDGTKFLASAGAQSPDPVFYVIDATDGPAKAFAEVPWPSGTRGAEWADDEHLYVFGSDDDSLPGSTWIKRCDFQGGCEQVVSGKTALVVGSGV